MPAANVCSLPTCHTAAKTPTYYTAAHNPAAWVGILLCLLILAVWTAEAISRDKAADG